MKNDTTRRYPRTLQAAFGPYTDSVIYEPPRSLFSWFTEALKPDTAESYQQSAIDEANSLQIPDND